MNYLLPFYWIKSKINRIIYCYKWVRLIWDQFEDYSDLIAIIEFKLKLMRDEIERNSDLANADINVQKINIILRLIDIVYNERYIEEYMDKKTELYGTRDMVFKSIDGKPELFSVDIVWDKEYSQEELTKIEEHCYQMSREAEEKTNKAHRILWALFEHNIRNFWY